MFRKKEIERVTLFTEKQIERYLNQLSRGKELQITAKEAIAFGERVNWKNSVGNPYHDLPSFLNAVNGLKCSGRDVTKGRSYKGDVKGLTAKLQQRYPYDKEIKKVSNLLS